MDRVLLGREDLQGLVDLICGKGIFSHMGSGLWVRPKEQPELYKACRKLEELGLIKRGYENNNIVTWGPVE